MGKLKEKFQQTEVYKSIFRHGYQDTSRNRALQIVDNVFLHLHPVRISRHATNPGYTWGMGGITFLLFLVLTITGVDRKSTRLNSSHVSESRMPSSA